MDENFVYVLIHSPLVGPFTWQSTQAELARRGLAALTPRLSDHPASPQPYWQQHAAAFAASLRRLPPGRLVLVAHSGAGPLLPALRQAIPQAKVAAYVLVDAGLPRPNASRLDLMRLQDPLWAASFHQALLRGERFPAWTDEDLQAALPAPDVRQRLLAEVQPRALPFFREPLPVFAAWPEAPCAYLQFSAPYAWDFEQARRAGWLTRRLRASHFQMLVDPAGVTELIVGAVQEMRPA